MRQAVVWFRAIRPRGLETCRRVPRPLQHQSSVAVAGNWIEIKPRRAQRECSLLMWKTSITINMQVQCGRESRPEVTPSRGGCSGLAVPACRLLV